MNLLPALLVVLLAVGAVLFVRQLRFGTAAQRLARTLSEEGGLDRSHLPRGPKGKVLPDAAAAELAACQAAVEASPDDWRAWFRLGVAHGDMGNPQAARSAVRRAVAVERADGPGRTGSGA